MNKLRLPKTKIGIKKQNFLQWFVFILFVERLSTGLNLKFSQCINNEIFIEILKLNK
jgi:hypothetical protein